MTRKEFVNIVGPLALRMRQELDTAQWRLLHESLDDLGPRLLALAVNRAAKTRKWFPKDAEFREDAEACRLELRASLQFEPCANCSKDGWAQREVEGVMRAVRCECWKAHQARIEALGVGSAPLALPAARESELVPYATD
jgi:hypothetical protein